MSDEAKDDQRPSLYEIMRVDKVPEHEMTDRDREVLEWCRQTLIEGEQTGNTYTRLGTGRPLTIDDLLADTEETELGLPGPFSPQTLERMEQLRCRSGLGRPQDVPTDARTSESDDPKGDPRDEEG